jgi:SlyX protein
MSDEQLNNLEARFAWLERHVLEQDKAMLAMADELRRLQREIETLRERFGTAEGPGDAMDPEERPPHY